MRTAETSGDRRSIGLRLRRNIGVVAGGTAVSAGLGLVTLGLNARALGIEAFGTLALIGAIGLLLSRVLAFQSWVPLIKLASRAPQDVARVGDLVLVAFAFDMIAATGACVCGLLAVTLFGGALGIPPEQAGPASFAMVALLASVTDAPTGLLRFLDRFGLVVRIQLAGAVVRLALAGALASAQAPLAFYIAGFATVDLAGNLALLAAGLRAASRSGIPIDPRRARQAWQRMRGEFWRYSWATSLTGTIYVVRQQLAVIALASSLGTAAVGLYHLADRLAGVLGLASTAVNQALYPEIARLDGARRGRDMRWFVIRTSIGCLVVGLAALAVAIGSAEALLRLVGGDGYGGARAVLVLLVAAQAVSLAGLAARAAVIVSAGAVALLVATAGAMAAFTLAMIAGLPLLGLLGAALAQLVFDLVALAIVVARYVRLDCSDLPAGGADVAG